MTTHSSKAPHPLIRWIHPPRQGRSQQTLDRLLDAAEELLMTRGFDEITVPEIASRAESSVGAFYARLKDKDGLLHALHQRTCDDAYATMEKGLDPAEWEGESVTEIIEVFVASLVGLNEQRPGLLLAVLDRARVDEEIRNRHEAVRRYIGHRLKNLLLARRTKAGARAPWIQFPSASLQPGDLLVSGVGRLRPGPSEMMNPRCAFTAAA
jgi:AcrR family transcriptional regulator